MSSVPNKQGRFGAYGGRYVPEIPNDLLVFVDEHPHRYHQGRQAHNDLPGQRRFDVPGTFSIEHESYGIGSGVNCHGGVLGVGDTTNFDFGCIGHLSKLQKYCCGTPELHCSARLEQRENTTQDNRARQAGRARRAKRGGNSICPRRAFLACLALHAPRSVPLADFFSILLYPLDPNGRHVHDTS